MKVKSIELENFAGLERFTANIAPGVTYLVGPNGAGKTTVGSTGLYFVLTGIAERGGYIKGQRYRFIGDAGSIAAGTIVLQDEDNVEYTISRKMSKDKQWLEIQSSDGRSLDQGWLNGFFKNLMVSPMDFAAMNGKEQAAELGIDTSEWDEKISELKSEFTFLNREVKSFGEIELPEKVERIDFQATINQREADRKFNEEQALKKKKIEGANELVAHQEARVEQARKALQDAQAELFSRKVQAKQVAEENVPLPLKDLSKFDAVINELTAINEQAAAYEAAKKRLEEREAKAAQLAENKSAQEIETNKKVDYLQSLNLPFSNLTIDDSGGLLMNDRPIKEPEFSSGELLKIIPQILASRQPEWKYLFLQRFDLLDEENQVEVVELLTGLGFQLVIEKVGKKMEGDNVIILEKQ